MRAIGDPDVSAPQFHSRGVPRLPTTLTERKRLLDRLDQDAALIVVRGPRGAGKTVLLAQYAETAPVFWVSVGKETSHPAAFVAAMMERLGLGESATTANAGSAVGEADALDTLWSSLGRAIERHGEPVTFIIDDAAVADDETLRGLVALIRSVPALRVIAGEDRRTFLDEGALSLVLDRVMLTGSDLMFTEDEAADLLGIEREAAQGLVELTGGMALAVNAAARSGITAASPATILDITRRAVESYFTLNLERADRDAVANGLLLRTSVVESMTLELATELAGDPAIEAALDEAERDGLGNWSDSSTDRVFTYRSLACQLLFHEFGRLHPDEVEGRIRAAAVWSARNSDPSRALALAVSIGDLDLASDVVKNGWYALLRERGAVLGSGLGQVPSGQLRRYPVLAMALALAYNARGTKRARGLQLFAMAVSSARSRNPAVTPTDRVLLRVSESAALRVIGQVEGARKAAEIAADLLAEMNAEDSDGFASQLPSLHAHIGISLYYGGRPQQAIRSFTIGLAEADARELESGFSPLALLSGAHALAGDMTEARRGAESVRRRVVPENELRSYSGAFYWIAEAVIALEEFDAGRASEHLSVLAPHLETIEHWTVVARVQALIDLMKGRPAQAIVKLDALAASHGRLGGSSSVRRELSSVRSLLQLVSGNVEAANAVLRRDAADTEQTVVDRARISLVLDRPSDTLRMIAGSSMRDASARTRAEASVLEVAAFLRTKGAGDPTPAYQRMSGILAESGQLLALALVPPSDLTHIHRLGERLGDVDLFDGPEVTSVLPESSGAPQLTERERVVLDALVRTGSVTEISKDLFVSPNTVKSQLRSIYRKLGVENRDQAIMMAVSRQLVQTEN